MNKLMKPRKDKRREYQGGFSLVELMIAIALGLIIMAGLTAVFVKNSQARSEIERSNRQLESGRYAMSLLSDDLRMAGFLATFDPYSEIIGLNYPPLSAGSAPDPVTAAMAAPPDPCATGAAALNDAFFFHVQGYDYPYTSAAIPSCLSDVRTGSDILVVRRVSTCVAGPTLEPGCDPVVSGAFYFQSSNCNLATELARRVSGSKQDYRSFYALSTNTANMDNAGTPMRSIDCTAAAEYRRFLTRIYFVANNNAPGDGIPTLKRAELGAGVFTIVPLVEGIETIQFEYGIDNLPPPTPADTGSVDVYTADPDGFASCPAGSSIQCWLSTYSVRINLLARNVEKSPGWTDSKTYVLGRKADGSENVFPASGTYADAYKRHAYNATVRLDNPHGRLMP